MKRPIMKLLANLQRAVFVHGLPMRRRLSTGTERYCPICESHIRKFMPSGVYPNSWCPVCYSSPRHRIVWLFLQSRTNLCEPSPKRMLHIAPELCLEHRFTQLAHIDYLSGDLHHPRAMVTMDITGIQYPENTFDMIYCSHVLEHVPEDRKAMREFYRVLRPGGWAILMVPMADEPTIEDPSITDPKERERLFGRHDHVRLYGPDFADRLREAGFAVSVVPPAEFVDPNRFDALGLRAHFNIHFCEKS